MSALINICLRLSINCRMKILHPDDVTSSDLASSDYRFPGSSYPLPTSADDKHSWAEAGYSPAKPGGKQPQNDVTSANHVISRQFLAKPVRGGSLKRSSWLLSELRTAGAVLASFWVLDCVCRCIVFIEDRNSESSALHFFHIHISGIVWFSWPKRSWDLVYAFVP